MKQAFLPAIQAMDGRGKVTVTTQMRRSIRGRVPPPEGTVPSSRRSLTDETERAVLLRRMLKHASVDERHDVTRRREVPIARLRLHHAPTSGSWVGITRS